MKHGIIEAFAGMFGAGRVLVVVATELESGPITPGLGKHGELLVSGVGKAASAVAVTKRLSAGGVSAVLNVGIAGSMPGSGLSIGTLVAATGHAFADEGVRTPEGFLTLAELGFGPASARGMTLDADAAVLAVLGAWSQVRRVIATVSTCSGTDALAAEVEARTGAAAETMEGAAVALACRAYGVPMGELRSVSNTTGDRTRQTWDIPRALRSLARCFDPAGAAAGPA